MTYLFLNPNRTEKRLQRGKIFDAGLVWDRRKKCARPPLAEPRKRRVAKTPNSPKKPRKTWKKALNSTAATSTSDCTATTNQSTSITDATDTITAPLEQDQDLPNVEPNPDHESVAGPVAYGIPYMNLAYSLPPVPMTTTSNNFVNYDKVHHAWK